MKSFPRSLSPSGETAWPGSTMLAQEYLPITSTQIESIISPMQTKKSQPEGKHIMPETIFTEFSALSVDPMVGISRSPLETEV